MVVDTETLLHAAISEPDICFHSSEWLPTAFCAGGTSGGFAFALSTSRPLSASVRHDETWFAIDRCSRKAEWKRTAQRFLWTKQSSWGIGYYLEAALPHAREIQACTATWAAISASTATCTSA